MDYGWVDGDGDVFVFLIVINDEISDGYCFCNNQ